MPALQGASDTLRCATRATGEPSQPLVIAFQFGGLLAAEAFEMLLCLALGCRALADGATASTRRSLASVYDPDRPASFLSSVQARVGPLLGQAGPPLPMPATPAHSDAEAALTTPMRGLALGRNTP